MRKAWQESLKLNVGVSEVKLTPGLEPSAPSVTIDDSLVSPVTKPGVVI